MKEFTIHYVYYVQKQENPIKETNLVITSSSTKGDHDEIKSLKENLW